MILRKFIKIMIYTFVIIFGISIVFLVNGYFEYVIVNNRISDFKDRGLFVGEDNSGRMLNTFYYRVPKKYDYEDTSRNIFDFTYRTIGSKADIIITNRNPMRDEPTLALPVGFLSKNFYVGHATINSTDDGKRLYEVIGNSSYPENNVVTEGANDWIRVEEYLGEDGDSPVIIGLRIKNTTSEQRDTMINYVESKVGMPYNFSFIFNRSKSFYCTDLVSRAVKSAGININYDYLATTGNDIIVSNNVYIIFIRETVVEDGIKKFNYYYLDD